MRLYNTLFTKTFYLQYFYMILTYFYNSKLFIDTNLDFFKCFDYINLICTLHHFVKFY